jgi:hypothetical protein
MCLKSLDISLMAMDPFYKSCVKNDLASLHCVTLIESLAIFPTEALSFTAETFRNNYIKKVVQSETEDPFLLLEEHIFAAILVYKNPYEVQFEDLPHEFLKFFS